MSAVACLSAVIGLLLLTTHAIAEPVSDLCTAGGWVLQEQCSPLLQLRAGSSICCSTLRGLQDLGCFCHIHDSDVVSSVDLRNIVAFCGLDVDMDENSLCFSAASGRGDALPQASSKTNKNVPSTPGKDVENIASRPALDLSSIPEKVTTIFQSSSNGQVTIRYSEMLDSNGDSTLSVDVDIPDETDLNIDLEYGVQSHDTGKIIIDTDLQEESLLSEDSQLVVEPHDVILGTMGSDLSQKGFLLEGLAEGGLGRPQPCNGLSADGVDSQPGSMELSVNLPEGFLKAFNDSDVNIDMEFDPEGEGSFSSAAITLDDRVLESSFNGKAIGSLLREAAQYLSSELSIPLPGSSQDRHIVQSSSKGKQSSQGLLLRGALGFLATVGEDIRDSIPDKQLHDGDVIQIQHDAENAHLSEIEGSHEVLPLKKQDLKPLVRLSDAVQSAMRHRQTGDQASWEGACTICTLVHKYINALWTVVIAGFAVLAYFAVSASIRAFTDPAPTDPNRELQCPLIVSAADYVKNGAQSDALILPVWSPPKPLH